MRRSVVCTLHSALWVRFVQNRGHSILPAICALGVRTVDCRERKQGATVVVVDGGGLERSAPVLRNFDPFAGQVTSRLGSSSEFSGRGHGLEALGDWRRRPLEGMGQRGVLPSDGHGRPLIHRGRACTRWGRLAVLLGDGPWTAFEIGQECCPSTPDVGVWLRTNRTNTRQTCRQTWNSIDLYRHPRIKCRHPFFRWSVK